MSVDATKQKELTKEQVAFFHDKGYIVIRNALCQQELENLRNEVQDLINAMPDDPTNEDYWWNNDIPEEWYKSYKQVKDDISQPTESSQVKRGTPFRIEYPIDKSHACKILMGHAFVLRATVQLLGTKNFIPTWDSMVFKTEGDGVPIKWHRDASADSVDSTPAIDIGYYLDSASTEMDNCLWVIPGSNKWPDFIASSMIEHLTKDGFKKSGAIPVPVQPGDVILHNILVLHGSPACKSPLRRTVYYEYRSIEQELKMGPHKPEYIPLKQNVLLACLHERSKTTYDNTHGGHQSFLYEPDPQYTPPFSAEAELMTMRFPHKNYFRSDYKG